MSDRGIGSTRSSPSKRVGSTLGRTIANGILILSGYAWGTYGFLWGVAFWAGCMVLALAVYGALANPWRDRG